jgi:hypothetical protein
VATGQIQVVHDIPGRLRLRLPRSAATEGLQDAVATEPGVTRCSWSRRTHSMLVLYEPESATPAALVDAVARRTGLGRSVALDTIGRSGEQTGAVREVFTELDRRVRGVTRGRAGLGSLVPAALTIWAVAEIMRGRAAPLAWSSALWYAHGLFRDYNLPPGE